MGRRIAWMGALVAATTVGATACLPVARVSVPTPGHRGSPTSAPSAEPSISADGRYVAFTSEAADLTAGDTNGVADIFVRDLQAGTTTRASISTDGTQATGASTEPAISADGRYVAFTSEAADLTAGDTNGVADIFVRDLQAGTTTRASVTAGGAQVAGASTEPAISASGDWVAFTSVATNLVSGDSNGLADVFVARRTGGTIRRASAPDPLTAPFQQSNGASGEASVIDPIDGYLGSGEPLVAYSSTATNLAGADQNGTGTDVFVSTQLLAGITRTVRLSEGTSTATEPSLAGVEGGPGFVATYTRAGAGTPGGRDVVSVSRTSPLATDALSITVASLNDAKQPANGASDQPAISANGNFVAFRSLAGDIDGRSLPGTVGDVYVARATAARVDSITPDRVGVGETRTLTVHGVGFAPGTMATFDGGITVNAVNVISTTEMTLTVTGTASSAGQPRRDLYVLAGGAGASGFATGWAQCSQCVEVSAVVDQPGPVDLNVTGGSIQVGALALPLPGCVGSACVALPGTVDSDGNLAFGLDSLTLDPIEIPVELIAGVETTIELVPRLDAPAGRVIPVTGDIELSGGLAIGLRHALLPSSCAIGPVQVDLSAGPSGDPAGTAYDQVTGTAVLAGGFTEELAITGCGFFTSTLNSLLGLPMPIAENSVTLEIQLDPILTGTATP